MCLQSTISLSTTSGAFHTTPTRPSSVAIINNKNNKCSKLLHDPIMSLSTKESTSPNIHPELNFLIYNTPIASIQNDSPPTMPSLRRISTNSLPRVLDFEMDEEDILNLSLPSLVRTNGSCRTKRSIRDEVFIPCKLSSERMGFRRCV